MVVRRQGCIHRYQISHPSGLGPQSPTSFNFSQFHPYPPNISHVCGSCCRGPLQTGTSATSKSCEDSARFSKLLAYLFKWIAHNNSTCPFLPVYSTFVNQPVSIKPSYLEVSLRTNGLMNTSASVSVVTSVLFGSAMAMPSTGKESFLDNSNDENVAFATVTRIMNAQRHYLAPSLRRLLYLR